MIYACVLLMFYGCFVCQLMNISSNLILILRRFADKLFKLYQFDVGYDASNTI